MLAQPPYESGRYAWVRVRLSSAASAATPVVHQIRFATAAEDYMDYLPLTYRLNDRDAFLARWLKLVRGEFGRIEETVDLLSRLADPELTPPAAIEWLAQWLGMELPSVADEAQRRGLIAQALQLYARRGTPRSIAEFVELHTGIRPSIVEAFQTRRTWVLGSVIAARLRYAAAAGLAFRNGCTRCSTGRVLPWPHRQCSRGGERAAGFVSARRTAFADEAYRFCVVADAYRVREPGVLDELQRIVDREKPAHTDYRLELIAPGLRVGFQSRIGIDAVIGDESHGALDQALLGLNSRLRGDDVARVGNVSLGGPLTLR